MALKLVLISPSGTLIDSNNNLVAGHVSDVCKLITLLHEMGVAVAIWSNKSWTVNKKMSLSEYFTQKAGVKVELVGPGASREYRARRVGGSVEPILKKYGVTRSETVLVGNGAEDLMAGVNNSLLLLRPSWYATTSEYGFPIASVSDLARYLVLFGLRQHPIYWQVDDVLSMHAMGPYSTRIKEYADFGIDAVQSAKLERGSLEFWHRLVASTLYFSGLIEQVDVIAAYPGHSSVKKTNSFHEVMILLGKCFRKAFYPDLIVRHTNAIKSATASPSQRTFANQLNTIHLNRRPLKYGLKAAQNALNLKNKRVLIVDDICTNGRSLESARQYILAAGGKVVLFSWLKTINSNFNEITSKLDLKPFDVNYTKSEPGTIQHDYKANIVDEEAAAEIADLLEQYNHWKF